MGRRKKYITEEDKVASRKERQLRYYHRNREVINNKNKGRYSSNKKDSEVTTVSDVVIEAEGTGSIIIGNTAAENLN